MAFTPFIEFGFSEITEFELGREAGALLSLTGFSSVGEALASFTSLSIVSTKANSRGSSLALFTGIGTANTLIVPPSSGKATATFISGYAINTSLSSLSQSSAAFTAGYSVPTSFLSEGKATANFFATEGNEFLAAGSSTAIFVGFSTANTATTIEGKSNNNFEATAVTLAQMESHNQSVVVMTAVGMANGSLVSVNKASAVFPAYRTTIAEFLINASSSAHFNISAVKASRFISNGNGLFKAFGGAKASTVAEFTGTTLMKFEGVGAGLTQFNPQGQSTAMFKPGSAVAKSMPKAYDVVIRPLEIRTVVWR